MLRALLETRRFGYGRSKSWLVTSPREWFFQVCFCTDLHSSVNTEDLFTPKMRGSQIFNDNLCTMPLPLNMHAVNGRRAEAAYLSLQIESFLQFSIKISGCSPRARVLKGPLTRLRWQQTPPLTRTKCSLCHTFHWHYHSLYYLSAQKEGQLCLRG